MKQNWIARELFRGDLTHRRVLPSVFPWTVSSRERGSPRPLFVVALLFLGIVLTAVAAACVRGGARRG